MGDALREHQVCAALAPILHSDVFHHLLVLFLFNQFYIYNCLYLLVVLIECN
jgi:hypothetical protein